jgi:hypothetical protein
MALSGAPLIIPSIDIATSPWSHSAACRFVLGRLYCPVPNQENSFRITVGEFSDKLLNDISRTTYDYTIPLGLSNVLVGSGTLVNIDGTLGILTAAHVITVSGWNNSIGVKQALVTTPDRHASYLWERMENLAWWISNPVDPEWGPDLAFIIEQIKGKKSFWPLTKNPSQRVEDANSSDVFAAVCGFVAEETHDGEPESGFQQVERLQDYSFIGGPTARKLVNGWDFIDVDGCRTNCTSIPASFGGVSGGGLWTFGITRRYGDPPGIEQIDVLTLAGVAFYELDPSSEKPALRCHGPRPVYEQALGQVRMWLHR